MGIFDSINPFKKKDEFGLPPLDSSAGLGTIDTGMHVEPQHNVSAGNFVTPSETQFSFQQPQMEQPQQEMPQDDSRMRMPLGESVRSARYNTATAEEHQPAEYHRDEYNPLKKELELISSKLDYLKASIEAVNQRLVNLEHLARQEMDKKKW